MESDLEDQPPALRVGGDSPLEEFVGRVGLRRVAVEDEGAEDIGILERRIEIGERAEEGLRIRVAPIAEAMPAVVLDRLQPGEIGGEARPAERRGAHPRAGRKERQLGGVRSRRGGPLERAGSGPRGAEEKNRRDDTHSRRQRFHSDSSRRDSTRVAPMRAAPA